VPRQAFHASISGGGEFLLKGALLLSTWQAPITRPTMDVDRLGRTANEIDAILQLIKEVAQLDIPNDAIVIYPASFAGAAIREDADCTGVRTAFTGRINAARIHVQIEIGTDRRGKTPEGV